MCFSAGVGRTGVFITLSIVLERMQYEGVVDVFQTVRILRTQRPAMVQTEVRFFQFAVIAFKIVVTRKDLIGFYSKSGQDKSKKPK